MSIGNADRAFEKTGFLYPGGARHFAVSVLREPSGINRLRIAAATREDHGHSGAYRALADDQLTLTSNQGRIAYFHALYVRDCIQRSGGAVERDAESTGARRRLGKSCHANHEEVAQEGVNSCAKSNILSRPRTVGGPKPEPSP